MKTGEIENFIKEYTRSHFDKIKFDWNGKHGDEFDDQNIDFRMNVFQYLMNDFSISSDELIIDLYQEISKCSKETWGVHLSYHLLAQEVLKRGKIKYLMNYLQGASQSFDTRLASARIQISMAEKQEIVDFTKLELKKHSNEENENLLKFALKRFGQN